MRIGTPWKEWLLIAVLALSALWLGTRVYSLASKADLAWTQAHQTKAQYEELEARKAKLQGDLDALQTPRGQDAAIRQAFGVARPGEEVIVVVPPASSTATTTPSFWQRLTGWF